MGIPGFFGFIRKYNDHTTDDGKIIKNKLTSTINTKTHLFLDFNGGIYTAYHKNKVKDTSSLILNTIGYLDSLVSILSNLETVYIALDGVPPRTKIEQQRSRRFHSMDEKKSINKLNEQYATPEEKTDNTGVNTNIITPGSTFMYELCLKIKEHIRTSELYKNKKVIFSGVDTPSEGEHKILQYIKHEDWTEDDQIIIYGLDADLIMLAIASHVNNIYLLREKTEYGQYTFDNDGYDFLYLDIDNLKVFIIKEFEDFIGVINNDQIVRFLDDYIVLCFLLGNDFIPKIPWLSIKNGGHDKIMDTYFQVYNLYREFLTDTETMKLNHMILFHIFEKLSEIEDREMVYYHKNRQKKRIYMNNIKTEYEKQRQLLLYYPLKHLHIEEQINPNLVNWRSKYYKICFNLNSHQENIDNVVKRYLESIVWSFRYYFDKMDSWTWYYPYHYGPTCIDIVHFMNVMNTKKEPNNIKNINQIKFTKGQPVKPQELLVMVLPYSSRNIMCNSVANMISTPGNQLSYYFPKRYKISIPYHMFYWECRPILPNINYNILKDVFKKIKLTNDEQKRNVNLKV